MVTALSWDDIGGYADVPLRIVVLVAIGYLARFLIHRVINRLLIKPASEGPPKRLFGSRKAAEVVVASTTLYPRRRQQRAEALGSLFKSITTAVVGIVVAFMTLDLVGYDPTPLIASAGVVGVALGFGAQNLVKDFISGVFMLLEDQYGVGDIVDLGEAIGTVEGIGLRVTRLRDFDGVVWHVRNGEILRVGNKSQGWSALLLDVTIAYDEDLEHAEQVINEVASVLGEDPAWRDLITETPTVLGVEQAARSGMTIRLFGKSLANEHYGVLRELRARLKTAFDREAIRVPDPMLLWPGQGGVQDGAQGGGQVGPS